MKKKFNLKHESGITLIALVITIIVLLILAGVAIVTLTGDNGMLGKASNAKIETEKGRLKETTRLAVSELVTEKLSTGGKTSDITAQNIVDKVKENEGKSEGITFEKREGATEPRNLPCYVVFDKSITSVKQTIKVPVELNLSVGSATAEGESNSDGSYEDKAKKEIAEIINILDEETLGASMAMLGNTAFALSYSPDTTIDNPIITKINTKGIEYK